MTQPFFSIVIAVLDRADTLERCLDSIIAQDYSNKEIVIMDGGSTDGTVEILKNRTDEIAYWESSPDRGITHAWNKALEHAKGDWVYFIGADDWLHGNDVLSSVARHVTSGEGRDLVVYGQIAHVDENGDVKQYLGADWPGLRKLQLHETKIPHPATFQNKSIFETYGEFDETYLIAADLEMLTRTFRDKAPRFIPDLIVANHQRGGLSGNPDNSLPTLWECWRAQKKHRLRCLPMVWPLMKGTLKMLLVVSLGVEISKKIIDRVRTLVGRQSVWE